MLNPKQAQARMTTLVALQGELMRRDFHCRELESVLFEENLRCSEIVNSGVNNAVVGMLHHDLKRRLISLGEQFDLHFWTFGDNRMTPELAEERDEHICEISAEEPLESLMTSPQFGNTIRDIWTEERMRCLRAYDVPMLHVLQQQIKNMLKADPGHGDPLFHDDSLLFAGVEPAATDKGFGDTDRTIGDAGARRFEQTEFLRLIEESADLKKQVKTSDGKFTRLSQAFKAFADYVGTPPKLTTARSTKLNELWFAMVHAADLPDDTGEAPLKHDETRGPLHDEAVRKAFAENNNPFDAVEALRAQGFTVKMLDPKSFLNDKAA
jgi:hypothetical protein